MADVSSKSRKNYDFLTNADFSREHNQTEKAYKALTWLRPNKDAVEPEIQTTQAAIDEDQQHKGKRLWLEMWRDPIDRRRSIISIAAVNLQAASGAMYIIAYGT